MTSREVTNEHPEILATLAGFGFWGSTRHQTRPAGHFRQARDEARNRHERSLADNLPSAEACSAVSAAGAAPARLDTTAARCQNFVKIGVFLMFARHSMKATRHARKKRGDRWMVSEFLGSENFQPN